MSLQIFIETVFRSQTLLPYKESVYTKVCTVYTYVSERQTYPNIGLGTLATLGTVGSLLVDKKPVQQTCLNHLRNNLLLLLFFA